MKKIAKKKKGGSLALREAEVSESEENETPLLISHVSVAGQKIHAFLEKLPHGLKVNRSDALEMHRRVDENSRLRSLSYWLFIIAACGIATLGLIVNSPAVIIGAMLVSPLMSPIIGLGMGIAINDTYLGIKSFAGIFLSFMVAMVTSAMITVVVPLHEETSEIIARTNPTLLDLFIALFCGLVAALSSVRSGGESGMKDVAPGAAIGVALMPPICVVGFGLGSGFKLSMMWGAFLLFLTNLFAIILISSIFYYFIYHDYNHRRLTRMLTDKRKEVDLLYNTRLRFFWESSGERFSFRRRFWFPALLIIIIIYPLLTSFLFLKTKNDVRNYIQKFLTTEISNILILRGPESLRYYRGGVDGNIIYSSSQIPDGNLENILNEGLQKRFENYQTDVTLVRIVGKEDIESLKNKTQLSLESSSTTLYDQVRHSHAADLVRRAENLLQNRFPAELGVALEVKIKFNARGMDEVELYYAGKTIAKESQDLLESTLRNELRELKGDVSRVRLVKRANLAGSYWCQPRDLASVEKIEARLLQLINPLMNTPGLKLKLSGSARFGEMINGSDYYRKLENLEFKQLSSSCALKYQYLIPSRN